MRYPRYDRHLSPAAAAATPALIAQFQAEFEHVRRVLVERGASAADAEDWIQEAFLAAWQRAAFANGGAARAFLVRYTLNRLRHARLPRREAPAGLVGRREIPPVDEVVASLQLRRLLRRSVKGLSRIHREAVLLFDLEEQAAHDVARHLSIPLFTFYSRLRIGRDRLADRLRRDLEQPRPARLGRWLRPQPDPAIKLEAWRSRNGRSGGFITSGSRGT